MTNGRLNVPPPPPPRIDRAIQYVAHPDFHFATYPVKGFRDATKRRPTSPSGAGIDFGSRFKAPRLRALVDGVEALAVDDLRYAGRRGAVGLFVDDGSRGFFANLDILAA